MAGTSGFEPEHAGVKVLCLTGLATSQYIIYGGQSRIWTCKSFPTNGFQDCFLTIRTYGIFWCVPRDSNPYSQKRTAPSRQRVYQIPPGTHILFWNWKQMDSNHRVIYCNRSGIASVLPYDLLPVPPAGLEPGFASVKGSCPEPFGPKGHIGRRDGSRTRMDIYPTASEAALYTSFSTRRKL